MFGLPEIDNVICQRLSRSDLAKCARVSKKWHSIVIPYFWNDLRCISEEDVKARTTFRRMVLGDYFDTQCRQKSLEKQHISMRLPALLSPLTKYIPWIVVLYHWYDLQETVAFHRTALENHTEGEHRKLHKGQRRMDQQTSTGTPTLLSALSTYSLWVVTLYVWQGLINRTTIDNISLEDFLQEQHTLSRSPSFPSALTRYGPWIRELPDPENLLQCLQPPCGTIQRQQTPNGIDKEPTALNLMRHLYKRCPAREIELLELNTEDLQSDDYCNAIAEMVVPNVRHFRLSNKGHRRLETWRLKYILDHCSNKLEELVLDVVLSFKGDVLEEEEGKEEKDQEPKSWTRLKQLSLLDFNRKPASMDFCSWLWKRCDHVEKLQVDNIYGTTRSLAAGMLKHMSNLREIRLGIRWLYNLPDDEIAMLLSGSRKGWRVVELRRIERFGKASRRALSEHFSSLEQLLVDGSQGFTDHDMIQVLTSCPHLHTLIDTDSIRLDANRFIDRDPIVAHFRTWACESTLKVLSIVIRGIPRPDLMTNGSNVEIDHDQQQEVQSQVYDRLARLVNLEVLRLGYVPAGGSSSRNDAIQKDCLAMSLESGLWKLEGLKSLRELGVARMKVKVGVKEVQWMAEHWPQLRAIQGLDRRRDEAVVEAVKWMRRHRPEIAIKAK